MPMDFESRLYPEEVYAVKPEMYDPVALDAVAAFLQKDLSLPDVPEPGYVRHILADTESGLRRFLAIARESAVEQVPKRLIETTRRIISEALKKSAEIQEAKKPKFHGIVPERTITFRGPEATAIKEWAIDGVDRISLGQDRLTVITYMHNQIGPHLGAGHEDIKRDFLSTMKKGIELNLSKEAFLCGMIEFLNRLALIPHGRIIAFQSRESGVPVDFCQASIQEIDIFECVNRRLCSYAIVESEGERLLDSPHYDAINGIVVMPINYMLSELKRMITHNLTGKLGKAIGRDTGDYRHGVNERRYYQDIWKILGDDESRRIIIDTLSNETTSPAEHWKRLKELPVVRMMWSAIQAEEVRHGIDEEHLRQKRKQTPDDNPIGTEFMFQPEGQMSQGFLDEKAEGLSEDERILLHQSAIEFIGKLSQITGGTSPNFGIAHVINMLETSRILKGSVRTDTFRNELKNAEKDEKDRTSWQHTIASRMIAAFLGRAFGKLDIPFDIDAKFEEIQLLDALKRIKRLSPEEIRKGISEALKGELTIPIDSDPFPRILEDGSLELPKE